ncbi:probable ZPR1 - protein binds to translation elongation factor eEF-1 [Melanopsichium pennsylvanicum]|uniref:Probable ZPR1 - protein binds to translation elongation factor eEF-1 n=2 Tax=Melanopsichium pennsylvanicum TaxID=63383 RepID=A0AAJ4XSD2_9BASI|nr:probable ZPR1-protein binds to translation elongation factor eEF-1 [Melanopsichium pennsylvanicum 4]SNX87655.1 probable ZPR1 - protein binds to translation elongation factor eEF-1 [Melanopsichium pennsylvanicum]
MKRATDPTIQGPLQKRLITEQQHQQSINNNVAHNHNHDVEMSSNATPAALQQHDSKQFFRPIGEYVADDSAPAKEGGAQEDQKMVDEIPSLCMECHNQGTTRMLLTYIPYFREVIVVSFSCPHCGNRNNEIQSAGQIQPKGCLYTVHVTNPTDLNRQVVKSEYCTINIPELQIEIPPKKGQLTTIEGIVSDTLRDLELDQPVRKHVQPEAFQKIQELCDKLRQILGEENPAQDGEKKENEFNSSGIRSLGPVGGSSSNMHTQDSANRQVPAFSIRLDDPSGNSFVEFVGDVYGKGMSDAKWSKRDYARTKEQNELIGLSGPAAAGDVDDQEVHTTGFDKEAGETEFDNEEVYTFAGICSSCNAPLDTRMKKVNIPYFKDILIMSTNCDNCGYKDNEVKSGSAISEQGRKLTLRVQDQEDLSRDILKSETAGFAIPEIDLDLSPGTLGGRFTTLEGLLQQVYDELSERVLMRGDSSLQARNFEGFLGKLKGVISCDTLPYTVILDDPLANSYIQNPYAPDLDEQVIVEMYTRSYDQNEDLGLNDINVDNY